MSSRYSFSLTTFSPSGKLVQIEHALAAVNQGATSVGIKGSHSLILIILIKDLIIIIIFEFSKEWNCNCNGKEGGISADGR